MLHNSWVRFLLRKIEKETPMNWVSSEQIIEAEICTDSIVIERLVMKYWFRIWFVIASSRSVSVECVDIIHIHEVKSIKTVYPIGMNNGDSQ